MNAKSERFHWKVNIELLHITSHISNDKSHKCRHDIINSEGRPNLPWAQCNRKCQLDTNCDQSPISLHEWKYFPRYWPFVRVIQRSPVNSPHKGQWRGALMLSLICALNKRLRKRSWCSWFETPSLSLWRHCNERFANQDWYSMKISIYSHLDSNKIIATIFCTCHDSCVLSWRVQAFVAIKCQYLNYN